MMKHTKQLNTTKKGDTMKESQQIAHIKKETSVLLQEKTSDVGITSHNSSFT